MFGFNPEVKAVLIFFITQGIKSLGGTIEGRSAQLVAAGVGAVLFFGEALVANLAPEAQANITQVVEFGLWVVGTFGLYTTAKGFGAVPKG